VNSSMSAVGIGMLVGQELARRKQSSGYSGPAAIFKQCMTSTDSVWSEEIRQWKRAGKIEYAAAQ
jgi:hypothetical protein